jgi:hypothetical protein
MLVCTISPNIAEAILIGTRISPRALIRLPSFGHGLEVAFGVLKKTESMSHNSTFSIPASLGSANLELTGLSEAQEECCYAALRAFLERNRLASWGLNVSLSSDGPHTWLLDISVLAPAEFDFQVRSSQMTVDKTLDLAQIVDLCLETHYNACMNGKAISNGSAGVPHLASVLNR